MGSNVIGDWVTYLVYIPSDKMIRRYEMYIFTIFVMVMLVTLVDSGDTFTQINQGYFTGTGAVSHMIAPVPVK